MQLRMKKYRQVGMKTMKTYTHRTSMAWTQIIKMMINKRNFKVLLNYVFKEKKMMFRDTSLQDSPFAPRIIPAIMWPRIYMRARKETSAPSTRGLRLRQCKILNRIL